MITKRQLQLLDFIEGYQADHGFAPSFDEMRIALTLRSKAAVSRLIAGLERRGYIRRIHNLARALEVTRPHLPRELNGLADAIDAEHARYQALVAAARAAVMELDRVGAAHKACALHRAWEGLVDALAGTNSEVDTPAKEHGHE